MEYKESSNKVTCQICDETGICLKSVASHIRDDSHGTKVSTFMGKAELNESFYKAVKALTDLYPRVKKLGLKRRQSHVKELLFDGVAALHDLKSKVESRYEYYHAHYFLHWIDECTETKRATETLEKYEIIEKISLLELAVWKASCLNSMGAFQSVQDIKNFDPERYKKQRRVASGVEVIIPGVLPFLFVGKRVFVRERKPKRRRACS